MFVVRSCTMECKRNKKKQNKVFCMNGENVVLGVCVCVSVFIVHYKLKTKYFGFDCGTNFFWMNIIFDIIYRYVTFFDKQILSRCNLFFYNFFIFRYCFFLINIFLGFFFCEILFKCNFFSAVVFIDNFFQRNVYKEILFDVFCFEKFVLTPARSLGWMQPEMFLLFSFLIQIRKF